MNYLAHLFLSGDDPLVMVGNFMGDGVKGSKLQYLHPSLQKGVLLHRAIDHYTDQHPLSRPGRERLRPHAGKYAGVVLDMFFDHLLAAHWDRYHALPLREFVDRTYPILHAHQKVMPARIRTMLPYLISGDWLSAYAEIDGLARALWGMSRRATRGDQMQGAEVVLIEHYDEYLREFDEVLNDVQALLVEEHGAS